MAVNYTPTDPVEGAARTDEVQRWVDYADTIGDVDSRLDTLESGPGGGAIEIQDWSSLGSLGASETVSGVDDQVIRAYGTLDANTAITIATAANQQIELQLTQDGTGGRNPTWSSVDVWRTPGALAPNLTGRAAGAVDLFRFEDIGGTCYGEWITQFPAAHYATVTTFETTSSTSYTDLSTAGPAVTHVVPPSGSVKVTMSGFVRSPAASGRSEMTVALSGANTAAAGTYKSLNLGPNGHSASTDGGLSRVLVLTGLTPGSTTFTLKYRATAGTGGFADREILVEDL